MRRLNFVLLGMLQLGRARQPGFSIHEDILAHPQFEVVFSDSYILENDAQILLERLNRDDDPTASDQQDVAASMAVSRRPAASPLTEAGSGSGPSSGGGADSDNDDDSSEQVMAETFEVIYVPPSRYLCSIPVLAPPPMPNQTATDLAKAEEAKELNRVSARGVDLVSKMHGECMYYISGWWSYSFCYGNEVVQFHAITTQLGKPVKDPHSDEYVLGRMIEGESYPSSSSHIGKSGKRSAGDVEVQKPLGGQGQSSQGSSGESDTSVDPYGTELQVKGDQKYMVQHLGAGTICDLTNRERTIEVQYHCNPGATADRISWIKEVTTCSYLMEVRTPRLCEELAFLPPKPTRAHPISCQAILKPEEAILREQQQQQKLLLQEQSENTEQPVEGEAGEEAASSEGAPLQDDKDKDDKSDKDKATPAGSSNQGSKKEKTPEIIIGGVAIGARQALARGQREGQAPVQLERPRVFQAPQGKAGRQAPAVQILARAASAHNGGMVEVLPDEALIRLGLNPEVLASLIEKIQAAAAGEAWKVEAVEAAEEGQLELRATILEKEAGEPKAEKAEAKAEEKEKGSEESFKRDEL